MKREIIFENNHIFYELIYKNVKNINLCIKRDCSISVSANKRVSIEYIDKFVFSKTKYIMSTIEKLKNLNVFASEPKDYLSDEVFYILGEKISLKVCKSNTETVYLEENKFYLLLKNPQNINRKKIMTKKFLKEMGMTVFNEISNEIYLIFEKYGLSKPQIKVRVMKARWGSCFPKKALITLSTSLLKAPRKSIEYVILHEYCHFIHPNHSKDFYQLVEKLMPNWRERKMALENK